jgi:hypothetical protein
MRLALAFVVATTSVAAADPSGACLAELDARHVAYKRRARPGIAIAVEISGPLGGVELVSAGQRLVIDCSLAVSLAEAGRYLRDLGIARATFSSAYARRNVRGTNRPSRHSYGLAIDVHTFASDALGTLRVDRDYEMGLGDDLDCIGWPTTREAAALKTLQCQLVRSGLFRLVLSPDFDADHRDHFHLEVLPWRERAALRDERPALH